MLMRPTQLPHQWLQLLDELIYYKHVYRLVLDVPAYHFIVSSHRHGWAHESKAHDAVNLLVCTVPSDVHSD